jgi:hypothetical protein
MSDPNPEQPDENAVAQNDAHASANRKMVAFVDASALCRK